MNATKRSPGREGAGLVGIGVAACAACCAGPILGFLAAIGVGIGTVIGVAVFGVVGLAITLLAIVPVVRRWRAPAATCATPETVPVRLERMPS